MSQPTNSPAPGSKRGGLAAIVGVAVAAALAIAVPQNEGTKLKTYRDLAGVLTYCTGATENAVWGKTYTSEECSAQLERDLVRHAEGIAQCVPMEKLTEGQRFAFVDTAYNIGVHAFCTSSMARKATAGDVQGSCDALLLWNKAGGKEVRGLTVRREKAREICLKGLP